MKLTASEIHFIIRNLIARIEWINDNPNDCSEEAGEKESILSVVNKLNKITCDINKKIK